MNFMLSLSTDLVQQMVGHCERAYPREACGALLGRVLDDVRIVGEVVLLPNEAPGERNDLFAIPPCEVLDLMRRERDTKCSVIGFFHSHPDHTAAPSPTDLASAWPGYSYPIVSVQGGHVSLWTSWRLNESGSGYDKEQIIVTDS